MSKQFGKDKDAILRDTFCEMTGWKGRQSVPHVNQKSEKDKSFHRTPTTMVKLAEVQPDGNAVYDNYTNNNIHNKKSKSFSISSTPGKKK